MKKAFRIAARNLLRSRRRNLATGLAVALGYAALIIVGGYVIRVNNYLMTSSVYLGHLGHISIFPKGGLELHAVKPAAYNLSAEAQQQIMQELAAMPDVEFSGRRLVGTGLLGNGCKTLPFVGYGVDVALERRIRSHPTVIEHAAELSLPTRGRALSESAGVENSIALGETLARRIGKPKVHHEVPEASVEALDCEAEGVGAKIAKDANVQLASAAYDGSFAAIDAEIVGWFSTGLSATDGQTLWAPIETLQQLYDTTSVTSISVYLKEPRRVDEVKAAMDERLSQRGLSVETFTYQDERLNPYYVGTVQFLFVMASFILLVVTSVVTLSILNSMTMSILERTREIGTLRSLGFTRSQVIGLFVREGIVLTLLGEALGLVLGLTVALGVRAANIRFTPPAVAKPIQLLVTPNGGLTLSLAVATLVLASIATFFATRRRVAMSVAELNTAVTG